MVYWRLSLMLLAACSAANHAASPDAGHTTGPAKEETDASDASSGVRDGSLPTCHWSIKPQSSVGLVVTRTYLICGGLAMDSGGGTGCPSDNGHSCGGPNPTPSPCVLACAPDQYAVQYYLNTVTGGSFDAGPTPNNCAGTEAAAAYGLNQLDWAPAIYCCPCE